MAGKSTNYYNANPEAKKKKLAYAKEYNKNTKEVKKRTELNKINRENAKKGIGSVGDGKDVSHIKGGKTILKSQSVNRGSNSDMAGDKRARPKKKK